MSAEEENKVEEEVAAEEGATEEADAEEMIELRRQNRTLNEENETLRTNFNSERVSEY